jgi:hypothetical protein
MVEADITEAVGITEAGKASRIMAGASGIDGRREPLIAWES